MLSSIQLKRLSRAGFRSCGQAPAVVSASLPLAPLYSWLTRRASAIVDAKAPARASAPKGRSTVANNCAAFRATLRSSLPPQLARLSTAPFGFWLSPYWVIVEWLFPTVPVRYRPPLESSSSRFRDLCRVGRSSGFFRGPSIEDDRAEERRRSASFEEVGGRVGEAAAALRAPACCCLFGLLQYMWAEDGRRSRWLSCRLVILWECLLSARDLLKAMRRWAGPRLPSGWGSAARPLGPPDHARAALEWTDEVLLRAACSGCLRPSSGWSQAPPNFWFAC